MGSRRLRALAAFVLVSVGTCFAPPARAATGTASSTTTSTPTTPTTWDPALAPLADTVARIRGLEWRHPVAARFLDDAQFDALLQQGTELDETTRAVLERDLQVLRALGLAPGVARVDDLFGTPDTSRVLAFYDPATQDITVRGTNLDVTHRVTLVHELAHALDDQHFDLDRVAKASTTSASIGIDELVEGDASRVADLYVRELGADDRAALAAEQEALRNAEPNGALTYTPAFLVALQDAPYVLGPTMVATMAGTRGPASIDEAFRTPPRDDEAGFDPFVAAYPHARVKVPAPRLAKGEHRLEKPTVLGPLSLYLVLASRVDRVDALHAVDGWAGDSVVAFRRGGKSCLRDTVVGHTRSDARRLSRALREFAAALPDGAASVRSDRKTSTLTACDAGRRVTTPTAYGLAALNQLDLRNDLVSTALTSGVSRAAARCAADGITDDAYFRRLVTATELTDDERLTARSRYHEILRRCIDHG